MTSLFQYVLVQFGVNKESAESTFVACSFAIPCAVFLLYPLSIMREMSALRYTSLFSLIALCYTGVVLILEMPAYYSYFKTIAESKPVYLDWNLFPGCAMVFFSFSCQI